MNQKLLKSVKDFIKKVDELNPSLIGDRWTTQSIKKVEKKLNKDLPNWYIELLTNFPLRDIELGCQLYEPDEDDDGIVEITFAGIDVSECLEGAPGCYILEEGYICIGYDNLGSGDPFFISTHEGDNPPVYQIYHDVSDNADEILKYGKMKVSDKLSDFFRKSTLDNDDDVKSIKEMTFKDADKLINDFLYSLSFGNISDYLSWARRCLRYEKINSVLTFSPEDVERVEKEFQTWMGKIENEIDESIISLYFGLFETGNGITLYMTGSKGWENEDLEVACQQDCQPQEKYLLWGISEKLLTLMERDKALGIYIGNTLVSWLINSYIQKNQSLKNKHIVIGFDDGDLFKLQ